MTSMEISPPILKFQSVKRDVLMWKKVRVVNKTGNCIHVRVKFPKFKNFKIQHESVGRVAPNLGITFRLGFFAHDIEPLPLKLEDAVAIVSECGSLSLPITVDLQT